MDPKGSNLASTDLLEISELVSGSYVTKSITGQEIIDSIPIPSSGITIGTTAITSGTVGRVLFEGTGNVVQESSGLTYNDTTKVFTLTGPIGSAIQHTALTNYNDFGGFQLNVSGGTERAFMKLQPNSGEFKIGTTAGGGYFTTIHSGGVERVRVFSATGNIGINTTTDAGYKLDVNGTARVSGNAHFGTGVAVTVGTDQVISMRSSTTTARFYLQNSGTGTNSLSGVSFDLSNSIFEITNRQSSGTTAFVTNGAERMRVASTGNVLINTTTDAGYKLDVNGTAIFRSNITLNSNALYIGTNSAMQLYTANSDIYIDNGNTSRKIIFNLAGSGQFQFNNGNVLVGTTSNIVSSKLTIESTTQGFLPPRMTTTQKNAIATPATGLMVYDTTLNRPCFYDGTSWITL